MSGDVPDIATQMSAFNDKFEEALTAMARAVERCILHSFESRYVAALALKALLDAGFTPIKSIKDLEES